MSDKQQMLDIAIGWTFVSAWQDLMKEQAARPVTQHLTFYVQGKKHHIIVTLSAVKVAIEELKLDSTYGILQFIEMLKDGMDNLPNGFSSLRQRIFSYGSLWQVNGFLTVCDLGYVNASSS